MDSYRHLDPSIHPLMDLPAADRAQRMLVERFLTHERLVPILDHVEFLRFQPPSTRASGLVVSGRPGSGKTMLARSIQRRWPPQDAAMGQAGTLPVMFISMTGAREAKILYNRMLAQLGVPDAGRYAGSDRERMVLKLCAAAGVRLLIVDEIQDLLTSTARQQRIALDTIKFLMNELSLPIVALGTSQAPEAMRVDEHLNARFTHQALPVWTKGKYLESFLGTLERVLPLQKASFLSSLPLSTALLTHSQGILDKIVRLVCHAAAHAVEGGEERVTEKLIARAAVEPPVAVIRMAQAAALQAA